MAPKSASYFHTATAGAFQQEGLWNVESFRIQKARKIFATYGQNDLKINISPAGLPANDPFQDILRRARRVFTNVSLDTEYIFEDPRANAVIAHCRIVAEYAGVEARSDSWVCPVVVTLWFGGDGCVFRSRYHADTLKMKILIELADQESAVAEMEEELSRVVAKNQAGIEQLRATGNGPHGPVVEFHPAHVPHDAVGVGEKVPEIIVQAAELAPQPISV